MATQVTVSPQDFGGTSASHMLQALAHAKASNISTVYLPNGIYEWNQNIPLHSNLVLTGESRDGVVIRLTSTGLLPLRKAHPNVTVPSQQYRPFIHTETAGDPTAWTESVTVENLTIDLNNRSAGEQGLHALWMGNVRNAVVRNVRPINCIPNDYDKTSSTRQGRGSAVFFSWVDGGLIEGCHLTEAAYEIVGVRYFNRDIIIRRNFFHGHNDWRHHIEIAACNNLTGLVHYPDNVTVEQNRFYMDGQMQDCVSCHDSGTVAVRGNYVEVLPTIEETLDNGDRCIFKKFSGNHGGLTVEGNVIDFRAVPATLKRGFECVRAWSDNVTVSGNTIYGNAEHFDNSLATTALYPWVGQGGHEYGVNAFQVMGNRFVLSSYDGDTDVQIIKVSAKNAVVAGNVFEFAAPINCASTPRGPILIDVNGASANQAGYGVVISGNVARSSQANAAKIGIRIRGAATDIATTGNVIKCAQTPYQSLNTSGTTRIVSGNVGF